jgi:hypothetical protein
MKLKYLFAAAGLLISFGIHVLQARADDMSIPANCRQREAIDNPKCFKIIEARFADRNLRLNRRDKQANDELRQRILASLTQAGDTIAAALDYVPRHIPFVVTGWHFVYARSGEEYAVLRYGTQAEAAKSPDAELRLLLLQFDDDLETDPAGSLCNSRAMGSVVWKVDGRSFVPCGSYANMIALGPQAFVWAVNDGRKGFAESGYDQAVASDFSFFSKLAAGTGTLKDYFNPNQAQALKFYWNAVGGYVLQADNFDCPPRKVASFTLRAPNCEARAAAAREVSGKLLPFTIIRAIRNHGFKGGIVEADVSISVDGGEPGDWMATAVYVAEHSIVRDITFATISVYVPNPWGDQPPQQYKLLAKVYYAPDPVRSPWKEKWTILGASRAGAMADIEYDRLSGDLMDDTSDPNLRLEKAAAAAKKAVIRKYGLPSNWRPTENLGLDGQDHDRDHLHLSDVGHADASMSALAECLTTNRGNALFQGCLPQRP